MMGQQHSKSKNFYQSKNQHRIDSNNRKQSINPEPPVKFQYKTKRKKACPSPLNNFTKKIFFGSIKQKNNKEIVNNNNNNKMYIQTNSMTINRDKKNINNKKQSEIKNETNILFTRTHSEPNLDGRIRNSKIRRQKKHRYRKRTRKIDRKINNKTNEKNEQNLQQQFGYEIQDIDEFLAKATLNKPANIPVVLAFPSVLYQTRIAGYQAEILLPLGMVVNAVFKNQNWLYVQTPHAEEGYVSYSVCLPLGIIPPQDDDNDDADNNDGETNKKCSPCWERSTDIFPKPSGYMTDIEKLSYKSEENHYYYNHHPSYYGTVGTGNNHHHQRNALSTCGGDDENNEKISFDRFYLRAAAIAKGKYTRHTLLVINEDYQSANTRTISVSKNEVVFLLNANIKGWFYVKNKEGQEGFIPSAIAGHGFL